MKYDVIVIGGGSSGMMAAIAAAEQNASVLLLEKNNELGRKLSITGGGRCNILNAEEDARILLSNYGDAEKFLYSAFSKFGMNQTYDFFESRGMSLKTEDRKRAFPVSESAADVTILLRNELKQHNVDVRLNTAVESIYAQGGEIKYIQVNGERLKSSKYILATGGTSRPETGSTGDGFKWLHATGHTVNKPTPNITPLAVKEKWISKISGVTAKNAESKFYLDGKINFRVRGDVLFTHFGLSAPTILNSAHKVASLLEQGKVSVKIDCYPTFDHKTLDNKILEILQEHKVKQLKNTLRFIAPGGLGKVFGVLLTSQELETKNSELTRETRLKIVTILQGIPLTIEKLMGFDKAVVADGGLDLRDIDTKTMRSRITNNLYVTGDLLDINRPSGGYSLQLCWTTGYIAGKSASESSQSISQS